MHSPYFATCFLSLCALQRLQGIPPLKVMLLGRLAHVVAILALAGSVAVQPKAVPSAGSLSTHGPLFVMMLLGVILIITLLQFLPAIALGPVAEQFLLEKGATF